MRSSLPAFLFPNGTAPGFLCPETCFWAESMSTNASTSRPGRREPARRHGALGAGPRGRHAAVHRRYGSRAPGNSHGHAAVELPAVSEATATDCVVAAFPDIAVQLDQLIPRDAEGVPEPMVPSKARDQ